MLTTGTFLRGLIHIGERQIPAGPRRRSADDRPVEDHRRCLALPWAAQDRHAAAPRRQDHRLAALERQFGDDPPAPFSFLTSAIATPQVACCITRTTPAPTRSSAPICIAHRCIPARSAPRSALLPLDRGQDRPLRRAGRHQIFLEPEGLDDDTMYPTESPPRCPRRCSAPARHHPRPGETPDHAPAMRSNTTMSTPRAEPSLETKRRRGLFSRDRSTDHRLRRGRRPRPDGRAERRRAAGGRRRSCSTAPRPTSACCSTTW